MNRTSPYKDGLAMLDNLLDGKALPDHMARSRAGTILPKHRTAAESYNEELRRKNDEIAKVATEAMERKPLLAICYNHKCKCGNVWQAFGFFARKAALRIPGEGDATFTKRLEYDPRPEPVTETEWQDVEEQACISCYGGPTETREFAKPENRISPIAQLRELVHNARVTQQ